MPLLPEQQENLKAIRLNLLDLHKLLLDRERGLYEKEHGPVSTTGDYLNLVLGHPQFEWLRRMSGLIVELDELVSTRTKAGAEEAASTIKVLQALLELKEDGDDFQKRYYQAVQESPDVVIAHCRTEKLLM